MDLVVKETRVEVARTIVDAIGLWLRNREVPVLVYVNDEGLVDYERVTDKNLIKFKATLKVIDSWIFGERESDDNYTSDYEASALIYEFGYRWAVNNVQIFNEGYSRVIYAEDVE